MSKPSKIRWSQKDRKTVSRTVQQFNAKITRTLNKNPEWFDYMPDRLSVSEVTAEIKTRSDFNLLINRYKRFLRKGAEKPIMNELGTKTTEWQRKEAMYAVRRDNNRKKREAEQADISPAKGTMGTIEQNNLKPKKFNFNKIAPRDWKRYINAVEERIRGSYTYDRAVEYKQNFLQTIVRNLANADKFEEYYRLINSLDPEFMYNSYYDDPVLQIQFNSDPLPANQIVEESLEHWRAAIGEPALNAIGMA